MKYFAVFLVICCLATSYAEGEDLLAKAKGLAEECKVQTGASDADVESMFKHEPAGNDNAKCLNACLLKKMGVMDDDSKINTDAALGILKTAAAGDANLEKLGNEAFNACKDIQPSGNNCEVAEAIRGCFIEKSKENGFKLPF